MVDPVEVTDVLVDVVVDVEVLVEFATLVDVEVVVVS